MISSKHLFASSLLGLALIAGFALEASADSCTAPRRDCNGDVAFERITNLPAVPLTQELPPQTVYSLQLAGAPDPTYFDDEGQIVTQDERNAAAAAELQQKLREAEAEIEALRHAKSGTADPIGDTAAAQPETQAPALSVPQARPTPLANETVAFCPAAGSGWQAEAGMTLKDVLDCWAKSAGWTIAWKSDRSYLLQASARFEGSFTKAAGQLIEAFAYATPPIFAEFYQGNRVVVITTPIDYAHQ